MMIPELEIFDASTREKRVAAVIAGKVWIARQSAEQFRAKIINQPQYYRILVAARMSVTSASTSLRRRPIPRAAA